MVTAGPTGVRVESGSMMADPVCASLTASAARIVFECYACMMLGCKCGQRRQKGALKARLEQPREAHDL